jgi:hypothetical protein
MPVNPEFLKELRAAWNKLQDIRSTINDRDYRVNEIIARLIPICRTITNAHPIILRHMVETKIYFPKAAEYYLLWVSKENVAQQSQKDFETEWKAAESKELSKLLISLYNSTNTPAELMNELEYLEETYGIEDSKSIPKAELPEKVIEDFKKIQERFIMNITINNQARIEAKYYVYVLEAQERLHHKTVPVEAKTEVWKRMTMVLSDEKKKSKSDMDQRIEKIEANQKKLTELARKEEIYDMGLLMKNIDNAKLGTQNTDTDDDPRWKMMKDMQLV